jgi:uncharacterized membrane protein YphA (DoxX/SURF4 family)
MEDDILGEERALVEWDSCLQTGDFFPTRERGMVPLMSSRARNIGLWVLTGLVALLFVVTGGSKVAAVPPSPENFARWGLSLTVMRAVGAAEIAGGLALLVRPLSPLAALGLIALMIGAARTGFVFGEPLHIVLPLALIVALAIIAWGRRPSRMRAAS